MTVYDMINNTILVKLKEGVVPWKKLWVSESGHPAISLTTGKHYNGMNQILLSCYTAEALYQSPYFVTYNQARKRGGKIKPGEKGYPIFFFKCIEDEVTNEKTGVKKKERRFILRYYSVFNTDQCDNVSLTDEEEQKLYTKKEWEKHSPEVCHRFAEGLIGRYRKTPNILHFPTYDPLYNFVTDCIYMPEEEQFQSLDEYYSTLFHEIIHSTGHKKRLNRHIERRDEKSKAVEELIAEIGAIYLSDLVDLEHPAIDNSLDYIQGWIKAIENDKKLFVRAASNADIAFKYIRKNSTVEEHSVPA